MGDGARGPLSRRLLIAQLMCSGRPRDDVPAMMRASSYHRESGNFVQQCLSTYVLKPLTSFLLAFLQILLLPPRSDPKQEQHAAKQKDIYPNIVRDRGDAHRLGISRDIISSAVGKTLEILLQFLSSSKSIHAVSADTLGAS